MFRCITVLKGLVIDIDSFQDDSISEWDDLTENFEILFITENKETVKKIEKLYGEARVLYLEAFRKLFAPSQITHGKALSQLKLQTTEIAYISCSLQFLRNAMCFLSGTIWIADSIEYTDVSKAPDLICSSLVRMKEHLSNNVKGFWGEVKLYPDERARGMIVPVKFEVDNEIVPLYMLGRYFGYSHYMHQLHPYSSAIFFNKRGTSTAYRKFDKIFGRLYLRSVERIIEHNEIDGICSVPVRPGKENRFAEIISHISKKCKIENLSGNLICCKDYPTQKGLSQTCREENVSGVFEYQGKLYGKSVIIIDDIITTGSTIRECIRELDASGAGDIFIVVLAVNQVEGNYWSSVEPQVICPRCGEKMSLLINGKTQEFFYSCNVCRKSTLSYERGREFLCEKVNGEFKTHYEEETLQNDSLDAGKFDNLNAMCDDQPISFIRTICCPQCGKVQEIDLEDYVYDQSSNEKEYGMGLDIVYSFDSADSFECSNCGTIIHVEGWIREYPVGAYDSENIMIQKDVNE